MGLKVSKQGAAEDGIRKVETKNLLNVQFQAINYFSKWFFLRNLVSRKRRRLLVGGYDLDMSYITDRILAMSFPAERMRAMYRNPMWQVKSVLDMRHHAHYKVYNLCIEQAYDPLHFHGRVERFPFDDNHVPPLEMIKDFCEDVDSWLSGDPKNIAVVHCMAGKGRTGLMVCSYLAYTGMSAEHALQVYADKRTTNNQGVSIPSQRRYVGYWEKLLTFADRGPNLDPAPPLNLPMQPSNRELRRIRLYDTVNTDAVFFVVSELQEIPGERYWPPAIISKGCCRRTGYGSERPSSPQYYYSVVDSDNHWETGGNINEAQEQEEEAEARLVVQMDTERSVLYQKACLDYHYDNPVHVKGDVRVIFYEKLIGSRMFYVCFNTSFIHNGLLQFHVEDLDKVGKKGRSICGRQFCLELFFGPANASRSFLASDDTTDNESSVL